MSDTQSAVVSAAPRSREIAAIHVGLAGDAPTTPPMRLGLEGIDRVDIGRSEQRESIRLTGEGLTVVQLGLADRRVSSQHARASRVGSTWVLEDLGAKNGTWVGANRVARHVLADGDAVVIGHTALVFRARGGDASISATPGAFATQSASLAERFDEITRAARTLVPIEIRGETGTGKELAARAIHALSRRPGKLVAINCGALPAQLLEAELFGHKRGAFTGADTERAGLVRTADEGTLLLDEIADLPASSQTALLRVLQEGEIVPVGGDRPVAVDVRVLTATHKPLDAEVAAGRFRADLRARLLGVELTLPPLRERREDLATIVSALLGKLAPERAVVFSADVVAALYTYAWPLNVRELERALAAALAVARDRIELAHLPAAVRQALVPTPTAPSPPVEPLAPEDAELRARLVDAIARHDGNLAAVARELGKDRTQVRRWMKRFGLSRDDEP